MKDIKKVVVYHHDLVLPSGGTRLFLEERKYLRSIGIKTWILTFNAKKEALFNYEIPDLEILKGSNNYPLSALSLRKRLKEINPDLVISARGSSSELYLATSFTSIPYVLHANETFFWLDSDLLKYAMIHKKVFNAIRESVRGHKDFIPEAPKCDLKSRIKLEFSAILDYLAVKNAKKIFVLSPQMKWEVAKIYGKEAVVLRGAIQSCLPNYQPKEDIKKKIKLTGKTIVLSVSRLDVRKRIDVLIKAFAKLATDFNDIALVIVGTGPEKANLKSLAEKLDPEGRIVFTGYVRDDELWDYYAACEVFATPAFADFDITPYEALALQKKVVWSSEMASDLIKDEHVIVADPSVDDFAEGIRKALLAKVETVLDLREYTWENYFNRLLDISRTAI